MTQHGISDRVGAGLAGADADYFLDIHDEYLAVTDASRARSLLDGVDGGVEAAVLDDDLDLHLGQEVDDILGAAIELGMSLLAAEALGLSDRDALHADFLQGLLNFVQFERLDDRLDL